MDHGGSEVKLAPPRSTRRLRRRLWYFTESVEAFEIQRFLLPTAERRISLKDDLQGAGVVRLHVMEDDVVRVRPSRASSSFCKIVDFVDFDRVEKRRFSALMTKEL